MTTKELNRTIREEGRYLGMCDEFYLPWRDYSNDELAELMYKGIDFVLKHHWPTNAFIAKNFPLDFRRAHGVFVDDKFSACNTPHSLVLGKSEVRYRYSGRYYGNISLRDNSSAFITAKGDGLVIVHMFEKSNVKVEQLDKAKVAVIKHSSDVSVEATSNVKIREEYGYLR